MHLPIVLMFLSLLGPYSASSNYAADIQGVADSRDGCWGTADAVTWTMQLVAPEGYRVRITHIRGDFVSWPKTLQGEAPTAPGSYAGVLLGFGTTAPDGSKRCLPCADNTMLYIQDAVHMEPHRAAYDYDVKIGGLLEPDGKLMIKVAAWLNTTGRPIHMEPSFTIEYQYEKEQ